MEVVVSVITSIVPHFVERPFMGQLSSATKGSRLLGFVGTAWFNSVSWDCVS